MSTNDHRYDTDEYQIAATHFGLCMLCDFETDYNLSVLYVQKQMQTHVHVKHPERAK